VKFSIGQDQEYVGNDFWKWRAWIEGKPRDLDRIEKVKWFLHPSFPKSVVVSRDRASGFRLETSGWGTFTLRAEVHGVDGSSETVRQPLRLFYPDDERAAAMRGAPARGPIASGGRGEETADKPVGAARRVFMSYASSDKRAAMSVRSALQTLGFVVIDESSIEPGQPIELAALDLIGGADATVAYVSSDLPSAFVASEIDTSLKLGKPTMVLISDDFSSIAGVSPAVPVVRIDPADPGAIAKAISKVIGVAAPG
jgi:hypothetical protein